MWTDTAEGHNFIKNVSQDVVGEIAPEELELFGGLIQEYFTNPKPPDLTAKVNDEPLGFGLDAADVVAMTPAVAAALKAVLDYLAPILQGVIEDKSPVILNKIKRVYKPRKKTRTFWWAD